MNTTTEEPTKAAGNRQYTKRARLVNPDRERRNSLLVGFECFGDGAHGCAVVSIRKAAETLLRLRELHQTVQPEVEVL